MLYNKKNNFVLVCIFQIECLGGSYKNTTWLERTVFIFIVKHFYKTVKCLLSRKIYFPSNLGSSCDLSEDQEGFYFAAALREELLYETDLFNTL